MFARLPDAGQQSQMTEAHEIEAGALALAISWGYADLSDAVSWADQVIICSDTLSDALIDLSLAKGAPDALSHLNILSRNADFRSVVLKLFERLSSVQSLSPAEASNLAKHLYVLSQKVDAPEFLAPFASHWDAIDLAISGVFDSPEKTVQAFLDDIMRVAQL